MLSIVIVQPTMSFARQQWQLSPTAYASIMTCGSGDEFYEVFGHSAMRICDTANNIDMVFNYGIFDFDVEGFYFKFARGRLDYCLAVQSFENFMREYDYYGRAVWEQRLNLTNEECCHLFSMLMENAQPENKYYKYDFFRDNCATRVDDMITNTLTKTLTKTKTITEKITYRDLLYKYNVSMPWWQLGTDILLGARCDKVLNAKQYRYIPMEMMTQYDTMCFADGSRVAGEQRQLLTDRRTPMRKGISPTLLMWLAFIIIATLSLFADKRGWKLYWLDGIVFSLASFLSLLLLFLWFGCDHWCTKWNMNLLWANPLLFWPLFRLRRPRKADCLPMIFILLILIVGWLFWPQHFNSAVLPIVLIILVRLSVRLKEV